MTKHPSSTATAIRLVAAALACLLAWPVFAAAQQSPPLAEIARREAERR
jgi:hypothetical protein